MSFPKWMLMLIAKVQARHPLVVARVIHRLTSKKHHSSQNVPTSGSQLPTKGTAHLTLTRTDGVLAANRAARIPGA